MICIRSHNWPWLPTAVWFCLATWLAAAEPVVLGQHDDNIYQLQCSADGRWLVTASQDATVRVRDVRSGQCRATLPCRRDPMYGAAFSPNGTYLAAVGDDCRLRVWRVSDFQAVFEERLSREALYSLAFSTDGSSILAGGADASIYLHIMAP